MRVATRRTRVPKRPQTRRLHRKLEWETGGDVVSDAGADSGDAGNDAIDAPNDGGGDATTDAPADTASDATDAPSVADAPSEEGPPPPPPMLTVEAAQHAIVLDGCTGTTLTPATLMDVTAGQHTIALTASTLSKGSVSDAKARARSRPFDDYVIVQLPLAAGDAASRRFFMLNGVGAMKELHAFGRRCPSG